MFLIHLFIALSSYKYTIGGNGGIGGIGGIALSSHKYTLGGIGGQAQ